MNHSRSFLILSKSLLFLCAILQYATAQPPPPPPADPFATIGPGFNPSMAIIMVVLISAFFFMGFFSVYVRQCAERRFGGGPYEPSLILGGASRRSQGVARGLDADVISSFPTFLYSTVKGLRIGKDSLECAVCLNEFEDDETLRLIPKCSHVFHPDCIDAWLESHTTCPVCRANLVPKPGENEIFSSVQVFEPDSNTNPVQPEVRPDGDEVSICVVADNDQHRDVIQLQSPDVILTNQNRPPRSKSTGWRFSGLFPRSYSVGNSNSLVQLGENCDRFTLRLPEEVRSRLMLNRSRSCVAFPRARSTRRGYRSGSVGNWRGRNYFYYERFDQDGRSDQRGASFTPPFRTGLVRSPKVVGGDDEVVATPPKSLFRSIKSSFDRLSIGGDNNNNGGERSLDRLRPDSHV